MTEVTKRKWQLIRENITFQIKLTLDAVRDLLLSPVAILCTVLDLIKGNSKEEGHFQRLMQFGHNTDHWLNLFGDMPTKAISPNDEDTTNPSDDEIASTDNTVKEDVFSNEKNSVDNNLDKLFSKIEGLLEEQQQEGTLTKKAKQKIENYLALLNSSHQNKLSEQQENTVSENKFSDTDK